MEVIEPRLLLSVAAFAPAVNYPTDTSPAMIASGDFNKDGKLDLVTVNESGGTLTDGSISILLGNGDGTFKAKTDIATDVDPTDIVVGDFNHDGKDDIAVVCYGSDSVNVFLGNGNGTFQAKRSFSTMSGPTCIAAGNFNNDWNVDLAVGSADSDLVNIYLSNGSGGFAQSASRAVTSPVAIAVGDFGNGHADLAVASQTNAGAVAVLLGNGTGGLSAAQEYAVGETPLDVVVGDFNHDDYLDLAVTSYNNSSVSILLASGPGTFQIEREDSTGLDPNGLAVADLNLDFKPDLAVVSWGGDCVIAMLGDNTGIFVAQANELDVESSPKAIVAGDFNGDGRMDLAVANNGAASVSVLLNVGPLASDISTMINENATLKFTLPFFTSHFTDPNQLPMQQLLIDSLPAHGILKYKGTAVTVGQAIAASQLKYLSYVIDKNYAGTDSFDWQGTVGTTADTTLNSTLATVTLVTTPRVTITTDSDAIEGGSAGSLTVQLNHASLVDLTIKLSASGKAVAGKNYVRLPKTLTILAGQTSAQVAVTPLVDGVAKGDLAAVVKLSSNKGYTLGLPKTTTVMIVDDEPKVSVTAGPASTSLGGANGTITFTRTGPTDQPLTFTITVKGTAKNGKDYQALPITVTIDALQASATIDIIPLVNVTKTKTVIVSAKATKAFSLDPLELSALVSILHV